MPPEFPASARTSVVSYLALRRAVGVTGLALPVVLLAGGWALDVPVQDDLSSYYHTPLRDVFVGTLCGAAAFLFCYTGRGRAENWTANVGCAAALGVAFFPIDADSPPPYQRTFTGLMHSLSGGLFFLTLGCYSLVHFPRGGEPDEAPDGAPGDATGAGAGGELKGADAAKIRRRNWIYRTSGIVILLATPAMGVYLFLLPAGVREACDRWNALFWLEGTAAWAFAAAWLTKGRAIGTEIALDLLGLVEGRLPRPRRPPGASPPDRPAR